MKITSARILAVALLSICSLLITTATAQDNEKRVKMKDLPQAVQDTVREQSKGATLRGLAKEVEHGQTYYEAELKVKGHNKDILIDPTGAVVEVEEQVALASLPPDVRVGIEKQAGKGKIVNVESITKNNAVVAYEAHIKTGKKSSEVKVGTDGQLIKD
jgi:uncharacterized membrane protein YkoI